jgi:hypothetical protein
MIPAPPLTKPVALYDTECYPNYWLLKFKLQSGIIHSFQLLEGQTFTIEQRRQILTLFAVLTTVSFNGNYYDVPMIAAALNGYDPAQLKMVNDKIIVEGLKPWELNLPEWKPDDHIDVMEVAPGAGGQKQYAGRIHCKRMQDLPYDPGTVLTPFQIMEVSAYCTNDLEVLEELYHALAPQLSQRVDLGIRYGLDLRSKSDAQVAEAVLKHRCEQATGRRIYRPEIDWNLRFKYNVPDYISFSLPQLQRALQIVKDAEFRLGANGAVAMPAGLDGLEITIGNSTYTLGIGGLHSQEKKAVHLADAMTVIRDIDVEAYYPNLMLNFDTFPPALGMTFLSEFKIIKNDRVAAKTLQAKLKKSGDTTSAEYVAARTENEGGKIMINGTFGKTGSQYSILFAPEMLIQTTVSGQLLLLMLIEWHEHYGIPIVSANTDGIVMKCPRDKIHISEALVAEWEKRTNLKMETTEYKVLYSRDINNYVAVKTDGEVKRKGEYSKAGLVEKKNPDVEICADAVAEYLANDVPLAQTIMLCTDIRKFVTIQKVNGGGVKLWGHGPLKDALVREMVPVLEANGWYKDGRKWRKNEIITDPRSAYVSCFHPQRPEYLGKVVRWYYGTNSPGPIVYASNGNTVSLSYGAQPCMDLPDEFPVDIDYDWYIKKADNMLHDLGYYTLA